ncbi:MAG: transcriptional repressor LexA [Bacilli bacterium]
MKISKRQEAILSFIQDEIQRKGYPPSVREIAVGVGLASGSTVHNHLDQLEKNGFIRRDKTKPRAIEVLYDNGQKDGFSSSAVASIPVLGKVTAGIPITAIQHAEDVMTIPLTMLKGDPSEHFMLRVSGDSMMNAGILDHDYVIVRAQPSASNGEIVVAMTEEDEATVKTFYKEKDHFRLQPENDRLSPILLANVTILGKVVGVVRSYN